METRVNHAEGIVTIVDSNTTIAYCRYDDSGEIEYLFVGPSVRRSGVAAMPAGCWSSWRRVWARRFASQRRSVPWAVMSSTPTVAIVASTRRDPGVGRSRRLIGRLNQRLIRRPPGRVRYP